MKNKTGLMTSMKREGRVQKAPYLLAFMVIILGILSHLGFPLAGLGSAFANIVVEDAEKSKFEIELTQNLRSKIQSDLSKYCPDGCSLLGIELESNEVFDTNSASLGFDTSAPIGRKFSVRRALVEVLVDTRMGGSNIDRLNDVLAKSVRNYRVPIEIELTRTTFPDSPRLVRAESESKKNALDMVRSAFERVIADFCPEECRLNSVEVKTVRMSVDEVQTQPARRVVVVAESKWALLIQGTTVNMSIDGRMADNRREQIEDLMRDSMDAFGTSTLNVKRSIFPSSANRLEKDADDLRADPWGLEKLGRALKIFKEFANTKEIIRERDTLSRETEKNKESLSERKSDSKERIDKSSELTQSETQRESSRSSTQNDGLASFWTQEKVLLVSGLLGLLLLVGALGLRVVLTGKQVQHLISEGRGILNQDSSGPSDEAMLDPSLANNSQRRRVPDSDLGVSGQRVYASAHNTRALHVASMGISEEMSMRLNTQSLRDELTQSFMTQPKLAREVFARVLREDGVEFSAKCVAILGEMIVFDLVGDDDLKKDISLLAEYIHVSTPFVSDSEQLSVLKNLKLKMTAGKMRLLTQRTQDSFDFLRPQSARQIYDLVADESPRSQAVVLTQLTTEKRRMVFELFDGSLKSDLLRELCVKENLPRDYLQHLADALKRKLRCTGLADGEILGGADVIIDLMERSDKEGQSVMMTDLDNNNPELARQVRARLVSVESLGFLSDGLLLEIFLSMEPQAMVVFLAGVREHVRNMILNKAPDDVADDWSSSATSIKGIDPETFKLAEMQVIGKIRSFASSGMINLAEINEIMFPKQESAERERSLREKTNRVLLSSLIVA